MIALPWLLSWAILLCLESMLIAGFPQLQALYAYGNDEHA
jgi:hypothetical protein